MGTTQRVSSYEDASLGDDAPKHGRNESKDSGEVKATNIESAAVDMKMDSGDNANDFVVADHEGNEVVLEEVTQEQVVEKLKTLEPEQLVTAAEVSIKTLGNSATQDVSNVSSSAEVEKTYSATSEILTAAEVKVSAARANYATADIQSVSTAEGYIMDDDVVMAQAILQLKATKPSPKPTTQEVQQQQSPLPPQAPLPQQRVPPQPSQPKASKAPAKGVIIREPSFTAKKVVQEHNYKGKGKLILVEEPEPEPDLPFKFWPKEKQIAFNEEAARKLAAELEPKIKSSWSNKGFKLKRKPKQKNYLINGMLKA